jgi:hypothetical protein
LFAMWMRQHETTSCGRKRFGLVHVLHLLLHSTESRLCRNTLPPRIRRPDEARQRAFLIHIAGMSKQRDYVGTVQRLSLHRRKTAFGIFSRRYRMSPVVKGCAMPALTQ